jgi:hypothetical protein
MKYTAGNAQAGDRFLVPDGIYCVEIIDAKEKKSKTGNPMIELKHEVRLDGGGSGPKFFDWLVMSDASAWKLDQFLAAAGRHPGEGVEVNIEADELIGLLLTVRLRQRKRDKGTTMEVDAYIVPGTESEWDN